MNIYCAYCDNIIEKNDEVKETSSGLVHDECLSPY